jgi:integrase
MIARGLIQKEREQINAKSKLRKIAKDTDIFNPVKVKELITKVKNNGTKNGYENLYNHFCTTNQIPYDVTYWKYEPPIPLIPSTENVNIILNAATERFYTPLAIMAETAIEGEELSRVKRNQIDPQEGTISVTGTKGHSNGVYKLSQKTAESLRIYLSKHPEEQPFPISRQIGDAWRLYRKGRAKHLQKPELLKIPLKNLRNYAGAVFYLTKGKDPIQTMIFMRHKVLQTTCDYLKSIATFTAKAQYITKTVKLGTPTTIQEITDLSNSGFEKYNEADGYQFFRTIQY